MVWDQLRNHNDTFRMTGANVKEWMRSNLALTGDNPVTRARSLPALDSPELRWVMPPMEWFALNVDGSFRQGHEVVCAGGLICSSIGEFIQVGVLGLSCRVDECAPGANTCTKVGPNRVVLECDAAEVIMVEANVKGGVCVRRLVDMAVAQLPARSPPALDSPELRWVMPPMGWFALNVDGSFRQGHEVVCAGGLIRSSIGEFIQGFILKQLGFSAFYAELMSVLQGLTLARRLDLNRVVLECDAAEDVKVLKADNLQANEWMVTLRKCRNLITLPD
ncbi:hypothetical protein V2J09_023206 [Rumex salicifolius]